MLALEPIRQLTLHWQYGWLDGNSIDRKKCYLAVVRAEGSPLYGKFLPETFYLYRA